MPKPRLATLALLLVALFLIATSTAAEELALPRVGTIGDAPPTDKSIVVTIERDGTIRSAGKELTFAELRGALEAARRKHKGRGFASGTNALLRIDRRVPWIATQWVLTACAQAHIARVFYAVLPEKGAEAGALAFFLPTDAWRQPIAEEPVERLFLDARVGYGGAAVEPAALYPVFARIPKAQRVLAVFQMRLAPNVPHGFGMAIADVAMRAGIRRIDIYGTQIPPRDADLKALVKKHAPPEKNPGIRLGNIEVRPVDVTLPAVARVRGRFAGLMRGNDEEVEELEEEEEEPEEIVEEPIETEEVVDHDDKDAKAGQDRGAKDITGGNREPRAGRGAKRAVERDDVADNAVERGLAWIASQQDQKSGSWPSRVAQQDVAVTALSVLAFLGAGYTDRGSAKDNPYSGHVRRGLRFLMTQQHDDGGFGDRKRKWSTYDTAIAALALSEAYWMTRNPRYKRPAQQALNALALARNPFSGWGHGSRSGKSNTATTVWCLCAIKSGKYAGLDVDPDAFEGARVWIDKMTNPETGRVGYDKIGGGVHRPKELRDKFPPDKSRAMTAAAVLARIFLGEDPKHSAMIKKGAAECLTRPPTWNTEDGSIDMYYWYFGSLAMFQVGGDPWRKWNAAMQPAILKGERKPGAEHAGSWDPVGPWGATGGRVYATALMVMSLEVYYRYDRIFGGR
ncbi:MAG: biopolymer transporter ExbD [Planctomycetota bacterium]|jgi:biopolymer transport protein ExbD